jgi:hypothetical protein
MSTADARAIIEANAYLTLATADAGGTPWASPVWFAPDGDDFLWASRPGSRHSRNIAARPDVAIVVFDSTVAVGGAEALYVEATAREVPPIDLGPAIATYSTHSLAHGGPAWTVDDVTGGARHRLYRARSVARYLLGDGDQRVAILG